MVCSQCRYPIQLGVVFYRDQHGNVWCRSCAIPDPNSQPKETRK